MLEKVDETIQKFNLLKYNDRVIAAVSGGPDSVALVYLLNRLKKKWRLYLHLAHLNHQLRKEEAERDSIFTEKLALKLNLAFTCERAEVRGYAERNKLSLEDAARQLRYNFLVRVAKENRAAKIALGHNRDDQAETVLMCFLRGSGISGLRGIPVKREIDGRTLIRPLIELWRKEIMQFLSAKKISFCIDSSNYENLYFRNRIRNELLPLLEKNFNPNIKEVLVNFAENVSCDFALLEKLGQEKFKAARIKTDNGKVEIRLQKFSGLDKALQKMVARLAIKELKGDVRSIDYRHWKELEDLMSNRPKDSIVDLPAGVSALKKGEKLILFKRA